MSVCGDIGGGGAEGWKRLAHARERSGAAAGKAQARDLVGSIAAAAVAACRFSSLYNICVCVYVYPPIPAAAMAAAIST